VNAFRFFYELHKKPLHIGAAYLLFFIVLFQDSYTAKLSPQPQLLLAFGLLKKKPFPFKPSLNSNSVFNAFVKYFRERLFYESM